MDSKVRKDGSIQIEKADIHKKTTIHIHNSKHVQVGDNNLMVINQTANPRRLQRRRGASSSSDSSTEEYEEPVKPVSANAISQEHSQILNMATYANEGGVQTPLLVEENLQNDVEIVQGKGKGEELRKTVPNQMPYKHGHIIYGNELHLKIGCFEINKGHSREYGTAFRVGSKYVMTAYHVVADTLESFWKEVYRNLKPEDKYNLNIGKDDKYPAEGEWSLANVIRALDPELQGKLLELGKGMITDNCTIKFSHFGNENLSLSEICHDVPFVSRTHDVAILELKDVSAASKNCISLQRTKIPSEQLHVIGHPDGRELQHDPGCRIINDEKELDKLKCKGIEFFQKFKLDIDVISDYKSCSIDREKLLFHCSVATAHGASGSPLIVIPKEKPIVTGMLIHGHPKFFYNYLKDNPKALERPEYLIESGISMEKVAGLLEEHKLSSLLNDIFSA